MARSELVGRAEGRVRRNSRFTSASSTPTSRAISARPDGSASDGRSEFGGQARSPLEQIAFMETMEQGEAPRIGASIQANALMMFGTPEQQQRYLPEILRGEAMHGMGYSEPQAGSDLAALRTSARAGRRALGHQRPEDLDHDLVGQVHVSRGAHRPECQAAARRHQHVHRPDECAGHYDPAGEHDVRRHVRQHLLRRRAHSPGKHRRRGQWRLEGADRRARLRARSGRRRHRAEGGPRLRATAPACDDGRGRSAAARARIRSCATRSRRWPAKSRSAGN